MKKLSNLKKEIKTISGLPVANENGSILYPKDIIVRMIETGNSENPIRAMAVAIKINKADDYIILEDAEYEEVKVNIKANKTFTNIVKAPLLDILDKAEDVKIEDLPKKGA